MHWERPILTDSGGFQVFSLGARRKISEAGVEFRSPIDGSTVFLDAERSMAVQRALGSDVVMAFDDCTAYPMDEAGARDSMERTLRWAKRSRAAHGGNPGALYGIVQGGMHAGLRERSVAGLLEIGFDGYAIGGLAVGEPFEERLRMLDATVPRLPGGQVRYLMGVATPEDVVEAVWGAASTSSTVSSRPATRATATSSCPGGWSRSANRRYRDDDSGRSIGVRLRYVPALHPRLPPPPRPLRGDPRRETQHRPQPAFLPASDGRPARRDREPALRRPAAARLRRAPAAGEPPRQ